MKSASKVSSALLLAMVFTVGGVESLHAFMQPAETQPPPGRKRPKPPEPAPEQTPPTDPVPTPDPANPTTPPAPTKPAPKPTTKPTTKPKPGTAVPAAPTTPPMVSKQLVEPGPYITRSDPREWTLKAQVSVHAKSWEQVVSDPNSGKQTTLPGHDTFTFESLWVVFPLIGPTASSVPVENGWSGKMRIENRVIADEIQVIPNLASGTRLGKLTAKNEDGRDINFEYSIKMTSYKVKFDETKATNVAWPKGDWPPVAKSTFQEQMFLDVFPDGVSANSAPMDKTALKDLVNGWLNSAGLKDPRDVSPVYLAKFLTGRVSENFQPVGDGLGMSRNGLVQGIDLQPIPLTIQRRRGSEFDITNLLVAIFRQAGLPARIVIAQEAGSQDDGFLEANRHGKLRAWAEFCLFDENFQEKKASINWIPADVITLRKGSTRVPPLEKPWRGFGTLEDSHLMAPFAFQFHPPTSVVSYGTPGFWGWMMTPRQPKEAGQTLLFEASATAKRSGEPNPATEKPGNYPPPSTTNPKAPPAKKKP